MVRGNSFDKKWMAQRSLVWVSYFAKCLSEELLNISMFRFQADMFIPLPNSMIGMRNLCNTGYITQMNPNLREDTEEAVPTPNATACRERCNVCFYFLCLLLDSLDGPAKRLFCKLLWSILITLCKVLAFWLPCISAHTGEPVREADEITKFYLNKYQLLEYKHSRN